MFGKAVRIRMLFGIVLCYWGQLCIFLPFYFHVFLFKQKGRFSSFLYRLRAVCFISGIVKEVVDVAA